MNLVVRLMRIIEVKEDKKQYLDLLLLADEQENMIDRYLDKGKMYVLDDNGIKCECIVTDEGNDVLEIKNIATVPDYQGKGYAKCMCLMIMGLNASASLPMKEMMCLKSRTLQLFQTIKAKVMQNP